MKYSTYKEFEKANVFGKGDLNEAFSQYFIGNSFLNPLNKSKRNRCFSCKCNL